MAQPEQKLQSISEADRQEITELLLEGRRVNEVIAHGLTRQPGWRRPHVVAIVAAAGWTLDSDGRVPRQHRTRQIPPATALPGQAPPEPPRRPVAQWPDRGTVTDPRPDPAKRLIEVGKGHTAQWIRRLAERAEEAMEKLAGALAGERERDEVRAQLAALDAQRQELLAKLGKPGAQKKPGRPKAAPSTSDKPIKHGTWGGYLSHRKRGHPEAEIDAECMAAKDTQMGKLRGQGATQAAPAAEDAVHA